jgi:hypothetical protein
MITDKDSKRILERMRRRAFSIDVVLADGKKAESWLCATRGSLNDVAAEGATLKGALLKLADKMDKAVEAELLS